MLLDEMTYDVGYVRFGRDNGREMCGHFWDDFAGALTFSVSQYALVT